MQKSPLTSALIVAVAVALSTAAFAADEYNVGNGLTLTENPLGMHGIDPVSMFEADSPTIGDAVFTSEHDGVDYYFASKASQQAFEAAPASYLPQYGGFCAFGVALRKKLDGDVRYADIVDGKLYLFVNAAVLAKYLESKETVLAQAAEQWPGIRSVAIEDL
ncbi:MAG: YHS domain-containing (seleno)protein [Pseudomonadota bacterium]